jgi:hypothetical protein
MNPSRCILAAFVTLSLSFSAFADSIQLQNLDKSDMQKLVGDFSANFLHTSVEGAATLGKVWGFEAGLVGGVTNTPKINELGERANPSNPPNLKRLPHAEVLGVITVPLAITLEAGLIPKVGSDEFKMSSFSLAAKWTPSELFFDWPVDVAIKLQTTKTKAEFKSTISGVPTKFDFDDSIFAATAFVSKNLTVFEPYIGLGVTSAKGDLDVNGSTTVFNNTYSGSQSASEKKSGGLFILGCDANLAVVKFGLEYSHLYETNRLTGKFSFYF